MALLISVLLAACWWVVYAAGGTHTAWPHAFYLPIILAATPFGVLGGLVTGLAAAVLAGPLMPLDVASGEPQELANWFARGAFFVLVGALSGTTAGALRSGFERGLAEQLLGELQLATPSVRPADAAWAARVLNVIKERQFRPVFQPIYSLCDGRLIAVEALTRFESDPPHPPNVWFEQAHRADLGLDLELETLTAAMETSAELPETVALSFNASPLLLTDPRLLELLDRFDGRRFIVEITEHDVIDDYRDVVDARRALHARAVEVAVDDAGAGFASLRHIIMLQPDVIKLDTSLTQNLSNDPVRGPLADALLQFAERTDSRIVVEGIETASDLHTWRSLGADAAQGYYLGRPGPLGFPMRCERLAARGGRPTEDDTVDASA